MGLLGQRVHGSGILLVLQDSPSLPLYVYYRVIFSGHVSKGPQETIISAHQYD